ncbi:hypothetical protein CIG75_18720 [Tumebacillus algifaecis]|uniref:Transglutaminase-like domain-containing protein n=1 Tax=Tumebacillus algifaecis TaxID=1214604 RepID=A0A223D599_9BACL|nr:transglutaminase domain-containing protein [Tumebacillus algifaecis]ASS76772.1 hypothetical protein CIG75_18720 [Tumebacillus algifaecis]
MLQTARWVTGSPLRDTVLFGLLWLWIAQLLFPLGEVGDVQSIGFFLTFLLLLFISDLLVGHLILRFLLKALVLINFVFQFHYKGVHPFVEVTAWLSHWLDDLTISYHAAKAGEYVAMTMSAKTTAMLLGLWLFQVLFRQLLKTRIWMFLFLVLGLVGLGVLDTFYVEEGTAWNIVLFMLIGLVILAFRQLPTVERLARMPRHLKGWPAHWLVWTLILSLAVTGVGLVVPKAEDPAWPDPVAYLSGLKDGGILLQKIGYGSNDDHLGGPFEMDDTVVFTVASTVDGYYRGETKAFYTGKGWLSVSPAEQVRNPLDLGADTFFGRTTLETKHVEQTINVQDNIVPLLFGHAQMTGVSGPNINSETVRFSRLDNRVEVNELEPGDTYTVVSEVPYHDSDALKAARLPDQEKLLGAMQAFVSLPANLPKRIRDLAKEVTQEANSPYDRAKALESYLSGNYRYETEDVPIPSDKQDFVDQFLFDSKRGYCDHFSSSFVVMARTLGMPARWVKGFTRGDVDLTYDGRNDDEYLYTVKNKNAHSWAEVYFDGIGWVAFEPTSSFQLRPLYKPDETQSAITPPVKSGKGEEEEKEEAAVKSTPLFKFDIDWKAVGMYAGIIALIVLLAAFINRRRLLTAYYLRRAYKGDGDVAMNAMLRLLLIMNRFGWKRQDDMSLREYALYLSGNPDLRGREMITLAQIFERVRYGKRSVSDGEKSQIQDLWTRIVRKAGRLNKR